MKGKCNNCGNALEIRDHGNKFISDTEYWTTSAKCSCYAIESNISGDEMFSKGIESALEIRLAFDKESFNKLHAWSVI